MKGSGCSSWPTAVANDDNKTPEAHLAMKKRMGERDGSNANRTAITSLNVLVQQWPTPMAGTPAQNGNSAEGNSDFSRRAEELAAAMWKTPDVPNGGRAMPDGMTLTGRKLDGTKGQVGLENQAKLWTTPQAHDVTMRGSGQVPTGKAGNACLARDAATWGTPRASDAEKGGPNQSFGAGGTPLPAQAAQWPTPAAQNVKGSSEGSSEGSITRADGKSRMDILHYRAEQGFSHPDPVTPPHGPLSLPQIRLARLLLRAGMSLPPRSVLRPYSPPSRPTPSNATRAEWRAKASWARWSAKRRKWWASPRLSPAFVTWLMGWPTGHALCACSETEFAHWQQDMRGALSRLPTASGAWIWKPPVKVMKPSQMELF